MWRHVTGHIYSWLTFIRLANRASTSKSNYMATLLHYSPADTRSTWFLQILSWHIVLLVMISFDSIGHASQFCLLIWTLCILCISKYMRTPWKKMRTWLWSMKKIMHLTDTPSQLLCETKPCWKLKRKLLDTYPKQVYYAICYMEHESHKKWLTKPTCWRSLLVQGGL